MRRLPSALRNDKSAGPIADLPVSSRDPVFELIEPAKADEVPARIGEQDSNLQVFIVGPARSGTSILFLAMQQVFDLPGHGESHVMPAIQRAIDEVRKYWWSLKDSDADILIKKFPINDFEETVFRFLREFYAATYGTCWVDKTPTDTAMYGVNLVKQIFPNARVLVTRRNGIEVVDSYLKKFGGVFKDACENWARVMQGLLEIRAAQLDVLELDQFDFTNSASNVAAQIARYLGRPEQAETLAAFLRTNRTEQSSQYDWRRRLTLDDMDWSQDEKNIFIDICGLYMRTFEYLVHKR